MKHFAFLFFSLCTSALVAQTRYLTPYFDQVSVTPSIKYGTNATVIAASQIGQAIPQPLVFDFYAPEGDTQSVRPLVLVLAGGFYLPSSLNGTCDGSIRDSSVVEICTRLAKMGYVAAAVDYRQGWNPLSPNQTIRQLSYVLAMYRGVQDVRTAIRYFKKSTLVDGNPYKIDTSRIVVWGDYSGGQIALASAYANVPSDWADPSLTIPPTNAPFIIPEIYGDMWGTNVAVNDQANAALNGLPAGDTLNYPNLPGYSSDFHLCVSMAGTILDLPWVGAGEMPAVFFHSPNDAVAFCNEALLTTLPPLNLSILPMSGSCSIATQIEVSGNNQVFWDANISDCVTDNSYTLNGGLEGFYPFTGLLPTQGRPWKWTIPCPNNPTGPTDGAFARTYLDTIFAYFAPRACVALALCNASPDPNGICGTQARGKTFLDANQNDILEAGEQPFPNVVVELQPGGLHAASSGNGNYTFNAAPGVYTLDVPNPPNHYAASSTPISITVPVGMDLVQNLALYPTETVNDLMVTLTPFSDATRGFSGYFSVNWKNIGTTQLSGEVTVIAASEYDLVNSIPPANFSGNTATWTFSDLAPLQSGSAWLQLHLPFDVPLGIQITSTAAVTPAGVADDAPADNLASVTQTVIGSFDPNDKRVTPAGDVTAEILTASGGWLDYTVRFQNTGTAAAANVRIVDTLSEWLNINTLDILGSSHPMRWDIGGQRTLTCSFDNIHLPDSLHDEPGSHGFVRYRIQPRTPFGAVLGQTAYNVADIYFDFNDPVRTNTTETKFTAGVATGSPLLQQPLTITPNPVSDAAVLSWPKIDMHFPATLSVVNTAGVEVWQREIVDASNPSTMLPVKNWPGGYYTVQLRSKTGVYVGRFVKK